MEGSPTLFGNSLPDIEDDGNELFGSQDAIAQPHDRQDTSTTHLDSPSIDAPLDATHLADPLSMDSIYSETSGKLAARRTSNRSAALKSCSANPISPGLSNGSSETPRTRSSQQTATPEDEPANTNDMLLRASAVDGFLPPDRPPVKKRRQGKQEVEDVISNVDATKRDKFLERNRVAATKCRQKKKEWVSDLEETRFGLESQNNRLQMEYSSLRDEITHMKSQLMEHASCSDPNIDKWIENEAKRFVLGTSDRYDQILANMGSAPRMMDRHPSFSSAAGYPTGPGSELLSPMTPSNRGSISFPSGALGSGSPIFYRPDLASSGPDTTASIPVEETYPLNIVPNSMADDATGFINGVPMVDDTFEDVAVTGG
ncbi:hypothetical protein GGR53DRAFT_524570 [Hypoxylon sp. FL1150]|nr:hypothetical protein GGR53DRAFT_524570 [Hypoxylon sp. FL1150]